MQNYNMHTKNFDYSLNYKILDLRIQPELYRMGKGEQGVLLVEPYKSEILPYWKFKTPVDAKNSADKIKKLFKKYKKQNDFVGMDMARKFLQMGYTRSRRYANHASGKKYVGSVPINKKGESGSHGRKQLPLDPDLIKAESANIFYEVWQSVKSDPLYCKMIEQHKKKFTSAKSYQYLRHILPFIQFIFCFSIFSFCSCSYRKNRFIFHVLCRHFVIKNLFVIVFI